MLSTTRCSLRVPTIVFSCLLLTLFAVGTTFAADKPPFQVQTVLYQGTAYGVSATLDGVASVGPTAQASLQQPCGTDNDNETVTGTAAGVNDLPLVSGGVSNTSATSSPTMTASSTSDVTGVSLLAGLISAQEIKSVSTTSLTTNGFQLSAAGSSFTNLLVAGIPFNGLPAPNTQISLLGLGYIVLNEQVTFTNNTEGQLAINMLHIYITLPNSLGIPVGTNVVVASASSGMVRAFAPAVVTGTSFGTQVTLAGLLSSSPTAPVNLPCYGTAGQVLTNSVASVNLTGILTSGTVTNTGKSALTDPYSNGETTTSVEGLNLLSGLISANVISGRTDTVINGNNGVFSSAVGTFTGISVSGHPEITDNVAYNTQVDLVGLGTLYLKHIIRNYPNPNSIEIRMIEIVVGSANSYGLPIGADIIIGDAQLAIVGNSEP
jgi:hypothetical protein